MLWPAFVPVGVGGVTYQPEIGPTRTRRASAVGFAETHLGFGPRHACTSTPGAGPLVRPVVSVAGGVEYRHVPLPVRGTRDTLGPNISRASASVKYLHVLATGVEPFAAAAAAGHATSKATHAANAPIDRPTRPTMTHSMPSSRARRDRYTRVRASPDPAEQVSEVRH